MTDTDIATQATDDPPQPELHWIDDGHQVRVTLDGGQFEFATVCPFVASDLTEIEWDALPVCRRAVDEDGDPRPDLSPTPECGLAIYAGEWTAEEFFDDDAPVFEVVSPFTVEYRFVGYDELRVRPKPARAELVEAGDLRIALNAAKAMNGVRWRTITRLREQLEQAKAAPGPAGLTRAWSGYDDDERWFPLFADLADAKAYAGEAYRAQCAAYGTKAPDELGWAERKARTEDRGYPGMFDLETDTGWVVCELLVHPSLASALAERPIERGEPEGEPQPQIEGQAQIAGVAR